MSAPFEVHDQLRVKRASNRQSVITSAKHSNNVRAFSLFNLVKIHGAHS